jgi:hypothetical protein
MIFVFGSNLQGIHKRGAALTALEKYGAILGQGRGFQGISYALPTKKTPWESLTLQEVEREVKEFLELARESTETFYVTRVGCGLAGFHDEDIAPLFRGAPTNCQFHFTWKPYLGEDYTYYTGSK